jgi:cysteine desulfurase
LSNVPSNSFYFDHNATTPLSPEVLEVQVRALREVFGNASSIHHYGQTARTILEEARSDVAQLLNAQPREIVFLSGGTEADNTALFGVVRGRDHPHIITTTIEHPAVLNTCGQLEREGAEVTYVPVDCRGVVDPDDVRRAIRPNTVLISVMHVNNEVGTIQPVQEVARIAREAGIRMHSDGVQAAGRIPVDLRTLGVDFYVASAHKLYGPKGVGVLYARKGVDFAQLLYGGRHEHGHRAGTENVPAAAAMGAAARHASPALDDEMARLARLRDHLEQAVLERVPDVRINGAGAVRAPNTTNLCLEGIEGEAIVIALDLQGFCVSSGSACSSGAVEPSHVLTAMGLTRAQAKSSIRISLGRSNSAEQVEALVEAIALVTSRLRKISSDYVAHA